MRRLATAVFSIGEPVALPPVVEELLVEVVDDGFTLYNCGPKAAPNALAACYHWGQCADLLAVRDFDRVIATRMLERVAAEVAVRSVLRGVIALADAVPVLTDDHLRARLAGLAGTAWAGCGDCASDFPSGAEVPAAHRLSVAPGEQPVPEDPGTDRPGVGGAR